MTEDAFENWLADACMASARDQADAAAEDDADRWGAL
jgi:hypothetical protein